MATPTTANPYWDRLLAEATHLREINSRLAEGMLHQHATLDEASRRHLVDQMSRNQYAADRIQQQVDWYRHQSGEVLAVVPAGPAWSD